MRNFDGFGIFSKIAYITSFFLSSEQKEVLQHTTENLKMICYLYNNLHIGCLDSEFFKIFRKSFLFYQVNFWDFAPEIKAEEAEGKKSICYYLPRFVSPM